MAHPQRVAALAAFVLAAAGGLATLGSPASAGGVPTTNVTITVPGAGIDLTSVVDETGDVQNESVGVDETAPEATVNGVEDGQADNVDLGEVGNVDDGQVGNNDGQNDNTDKATSGDNNGDNSDGSTSDNSNG